MVFKGLFQLKSFFPSMILPYPVMPWGENPSSVGVKQEGSSGADCKSGLGKRRGPCDAAALVCFPDLLPFLQLKFAFPMPTSAGAAAAPWLLLWARLSHGTPPSLEPKLDFNREKTPLPLTADHRDDLGSCTKAGRRYLARNLFNLPDDSLPHALHHFYGPAECAGPGRRCRTQPVLPSKRLIHHR